jgi:hypothetical protein
LNSAIVHHGKERPPASPGSKPDLALAAPALTAGTTGPRPAACHAVHSLAGALSVLALTFVPRIAEAHVKWFAAYNVAETPKSLDWVRDGTFIDLALVAIVLLTVGGLIANTVLGRAVMVSVDRVTALLRRDTEILMRAVYGGFFVSLWTAGGIIMTPELKTPVAAISWLQLAIAACFIWRQTLVLAAAGIVFLYGYAIVHYGLFHLLDYPIFLGSASYFALIGLGFDRRGLHPVDVLRWAAAVTLMWASVEKWAYPQWTYPLFVSHAGMALGFEPVFYMKAAGVVEFSLAFALIGPPLVRRAAAVLLAATFVSAVPEFGKIDAIGHSPIIVVFLAIIADSTPGRRFTALRMPAYYVIAFVLTVAAYYLGHAALFPSGGA